MQQQQAARKKEIRLKIFITQKCRAVPRNTTHLNHSDRASIRIFDGHAEDGLVNKFRALIYRRVKTRVLVRVNYVHRLGSDFTKHNKIAKIRLSHCAYKIAY